MKYMGMAHGQFGVLSVRKSIQPASAASFAPLARCAVASTARLPSTARLDPAYVRMILGGSRPATALQQAAAPVQPPSSLNRAASTNDVLAHVQPELFDEWVVHRPLPGREPLRTARSAAAHRPPRP
ncbi:MAG: hypothetical protein ACK4ZJ_16275, partial [Allorhizobium sp.]